jgi:tetratricopeptide (TPR) repeat protein
MVKRFKSVKGPLVAAVCSLVAVGFLASPAVAADKKETLTEAVAKQLKPSQDAIQKGDFDTALTLAKAGLAASVKPYDKETSLRMITYAAAKKQDYATYAEYTEQLLDAVPTMSDDEKARDYKALAQINAQNKVYDKALAWAAKWAEATKASDAYALSSQIYLIQGDYANAAPLIEKSIAGRDATEQELRQLNVVYYKVGDKAKRQATLETLVQKFLKREYMIDLMAVYEGDAEPRAMLSLYRLAYEHDFLTKESEFVNYADGALDAGAPAEALNVLEAGIKKDAVKLVAPTDRNSKMLAQAKQQTAEDKKLLPQLDKEARAGKNGEADVKVGLAYLGFGQYDQAIEAIERGLSADRIGKVKRVDDAQMTLGIAYLKAGKTDKAIAAFEAAKADPRMKRTANLWLIALPKTGG